MSKTFFNGKARNQDEVSLTRYAGVGGRSLQISVRRYMESLDCPEDSREKQLLPGWGGVNLTLSEAMALRDALTYFVEGHVEDGDIEGDFSRPLSYNQRKLIEKGFSIIRIGH